MVYLSWRLGKPPCTVHIFIPTILLLALFRKEERAFLRKSRISLLFQHKLCRAGKLPLNLSEKRTARQGANTLTQFMRTGQPVPKSPADASCTGI